MSINLMKLPMGTRLDTFVLANGYQYVRRRLACLDGYVGNAVWILEEFDSGASNGRYTVSIDISDFVDLWGPVRTTDGKKDFGPRYIRPSSQKGASFAKVMRNPAYKPVKIAKEKLKYTERSKLQHNCSEIYRFHDADSKESLM